jgi:hypothetical protein
MTPQGLDSDFEVDLSFDKKSENIKDGQSERSILVADEINTSKQSQAGEAKPVSLFFEPFDQANPRCCQRRGERVRTQNGHENHSEAPRRQRRVIHHSIEKQ